METRNDYIAGAYFTLDGQGQILRANILDSELLGLDGVCLNNRSLADFVDPGDRGLFSAYCAEASKTNSRRSCNLRLLHNGNRPLPVKMESLPVPVEGKNAVVLQTVVVKMAESEEAREALVQKDEIYTVALRKAGIGTWEWDTGSGRLWWSDVTESIFGFFPGEFSGTYEAFLDCVHPEDRETVAASITGCIESGRDYCIEHRIVKPDGSVVWVLETGDVIRDEEGNVVRMAGIVQDITEQKRKRDRANEMTERLERLVKERTQELTEANNALHEEIAERKQTERELVEKEQDLRRLSTKLVDAQEDERKRVARELHDSIAGKLSAIKYGVEKKLGEMGADVASGGITLEDVLSEVKEAIEETRRISRNLWPSQLEDLGLIPSIDGLIRQFKTHNPDVEMVKEIDVEENKIPKRLKIAIYRILQEALNNAGKYSAASRIRVSLARKNSNLEFCAKDNGRGFDPEMVLNPEGDSSGMGLESMKERTEVSEGDFSVWSKPGEGTAVFATWRLDSG